MFFNLSGVQRGSLPPKDADIGIINSLIQFLQIYQF